MENFSHKKDFSVFLMYLYLCIYLEYNKQSNEEGTFIPVRYSGFGI